MNNIDLEQLYFELKQIEAVLGLFESLDKNISVEYISSVAMIYREKMQTILVKIKSSINNDQ